MEKKEVKKCKKRLNILEIAATDKENLSTKIHRKKMSVHNAKMPLGKRTKKTAELDNKSSTQIRININKKKDQLTQSSSIIENDLIVDNPSENYWQNLAESCKKALETALKENLDLHNKINELEYEKSRLQSMLDEAKNLVEVLTEMIEDNNDECNENVNMEANETAREDSVLDESKECSDSDPEDTSFQSCF